jgi:GNAT superfamily N-acetyltransferase
MNTLPELKIESGYIPGAIGRITELHGAYYHAYWGFGLYFEAKVATGLAEFLQRHDPDRDGIWFAVVNGRVEGSIIIDGIHADEKGAHLRWFILSEALRGKGVGRKLINRAREFWAGRGYRKVYLWTFEGLSAARRLYEDAGFKLIAQQHGTQWGTAVNEQYFEWANE